VIYGLMRTAEARAPIDAPAVATSLLVFVIVYFLVFGAGTIYILRLMKHAPHHGETAPAQAPIRSAGITPSSSIRRRSQESDLEPDTTEEGR